MPQIKYLFTIFGESPNELPINNNSMARAFTKDWQSLIFNANIRKNFKRKLHSFIDFVYYKIVSIGRSNRYSGYLISKTRIGTFHIDYDVSSTINKLDFEENLKKRIEVMSDPISVNKISMVTSNSIRNAILTSMIVKIPWLDEKSNSEKNEYTLIRYIKLRSEDEYKSDRREILLTKLHEK